MSSNLNDVDDRLLHAKNLLKKYQSKQVSNSTADGRALNEEVPNNNDYEYVQNCIQHNAVPSNPSIGSTRPSSVVAGERNSIDSSLSFYHNSQSHLSENVEASQLKLLLKEKDIALDDALMKLHELHTHYSELYLAYNASVQNAQVNIAPEQAAQISQLQTTLAVAIEEKTNLQSELRRKQSQLEAIENEHAVFQEGSKTLHVLSAKFEQELTQLRLERDRLLETIANQSAHIETHRKESSSLEAKIILIHQDRNETQARLKYLYDEKVKLEKDFEQLKNDLNMKDIYIKQLTRFSQSDPTQDQLAIQTLSDEKKRFETQVQEKENEIVEIKKQFESARYYYDNCVLDMGRQTTQLESEAQSLKVIKNDLESKNRYQEEQLRLFKVSLDAYVTEKDQLNNEEVLANNEDQFSLEEVLALQNNFSTLQSDFLRCRERIQDLENIIEQKDSQMEEIQFEFIDAQRKIAGFEESKRFQSSINSDVNTLSEQLQNEKATVSRAVVQNIELKKQLAELQDKFVDVINESAAKEDERLSALSNVKLLRAQVEKFSQAREFSVIDNSSLISNSDDSLDTKSLNVFSNLEVVPSLSSLNIEYQTESYNESLPISIQNDSSYKNTSTQVASCHDEFLPESNSSYNSVIIDEIAKECHVDESIESNELNSEKESSTSKNLEFNNVKERREPSIQNQTTSSAVSIYDSKPSLIEDIQYRLSLALHEKEKYRLSSEHLDHLLTALEAENESIGEYISLYHLQRAKIHKKVAEKDVALTRLQQENFDLIKQLSELQNAVLLFGSVASRTGTPQVLFNAFKKLEINGEEGDDTSQNDKDRTIEETVNGLSLSNTNERFIQPETPSIDIIQTNNESYIDNKNKSVYNEDGLNADAKENISRTLERLIKIVDSQKKRDFSRKFAANAKNSEDTTIGCSGCVECRGELFIL